MALNLLQIGRGIGRGGGRVGAVVNADAAHAAIAATANKRGIGTVVAGSTGGRYSIGVNGDSAAADEDGTAGAAAARAARSA